ncbi:class I SAM-dependent methyltransferase [Streptomyces pinistramenti]|uniref:class I SAM-dependent methyltransferase n=1 Tax=Streptomyces pinistramenti TaxID=2884812 RepID=UPI001D07B4B1|nr:class I SAM-dependent methyltransferase [Streptomyces pinistramenti]MCB5912345.1 methyltransferase domain-containing protein [Streptomyces pinistramenti]
MNPHHTGDLDWDAMGARLEREAELHTPALDQSAAWLRELLGGEGAVAGVGRVLDVGSGPGVAACRLARAFPFADVVAVDGSAGLLERAAQRAAAHHLGTRLSTHHTDLPAGFATLPATDVIWTSQAIHHLGDQAAALKALAAALRPGGLLAVAERGLPPRFLPRDIGLGRPGLQARLDAAAEDRFTVMRGQLPGATATVEDWPALLARAGLIPTGTRTFLTDLPAPLDLPAREHLHIHLTRLRDQLGEHLDTADRTTLECLIDGDARTGILWRPDAFYLAATTVHTARACPRF